MEFLQPVHASLRLLGPRDRRLLGLATLIQVTIAVFDLVAVLLIGVVAAMSMSALTGDDPPKLVGQFLEGLGRDSMPLGQAAVYVGVIAAVILICKTVLSAFMTRRVLRFLARRQAKVSGDLVEALLAKPLVQLQQRSSQETVFALTGGVNNAILVVLGQGTVVIAESAVLAMVAVGLLVVDPLLTIFALIYFAIVAAVLSRTLSGFAVTLGKQFTSLEIDSYAAIQEALATYRELTVTGRRAAYVDRVQLLRWRAAGVTSDRQFIGLVPKYVSEVALVIGAAMLAVSQFITKDVTAAVAVIAVFLVAGSRVVPSLLRMQGAFLSVRSAGASAKPTYELAKQVLNPVVDDETRPLVVPDFRETTAHIKNGHVGFDSSIVLEKVSVQFPNAKSMAVQDVCIRVAAGASLALVGSTGAGKSTLADVILGVLEPSAGQVTIGGYSPTQAVARWPGAISYVPQTIALANSTVRANVALGIPEAEIDDDLVWEALERAHLASLLRVGREGLSTRIGEGGVMLSGGQRQRLGIARALYTRPRLLVLDEATSALDAETEEAITSTLRTLEGATTTVTVAHRLATIRHCDVIVYLEQGRVAAQGTFAEVRLQSERFDAQSRLLGMS